MLFTFWSVLACLTVAGRSRACIPLAVATDKQTRSPLLLLACCCCQAMLLVEEK
jgi:hypothetical protein